MYGAEQKLPVQVEDMQARKEIARSLGAVTHRQIWRKTPEAPAVACWLAPYAPR